MLVGDMVNAKAMEAKMDGITFKSSLILPKMNKQIKILL